MLEFSSVAMLLESVTSSLLSDLFFFTGDEK
jgi:hypothetical protein